MAYEVMILCHLHMPLYFLGTFTEYPSVSPHIAKNKSNITNLFFMIINKYVNIMSQMYGITPYRFKDHVTHLFPVVTSFTKYA